MSLRHLSRASRALPSTLTALRSYTTPATSIHPLSSTSKRSTPKSTSSADTFISPSYEEPEPTSFERLDVSARVPSTAIDSCSSQGFVLNSGVRIMDGSGLLLLGGEAFRWRPWLTMPHSEDEKNTRGKMIPTTSEVWDIPDEAWGLLSLAWPRPDILVIGVGPQTRPVSKRVRDHLAGLGIRIELAATTSAASAYNLLATERGVNEVAAALLPA